MIPSHNRAIQSTLNCSVFFMTLLVACQSGNDNDFVSKFGDRNFKEYMNTVVYFRSLDDNGNFIYFFNSLTDTCEAPYIVTVSKISKKAISVGMKLRKAPCDKIGVDTVLVKSLVEGFIEFDIRLLKVESDCTVYVNIDVASERADLIRSTNPKPPAELRNFKRVKDNWYMRK
jgi:hypothetical protein